ncbi:hypothetical protein CEXT_170251 [Caerostris extrusa]|uniref:Uncharacterized protein n=1 Tax=Caerostris extrusa TaxID=172846 RepID=A0AAV4YD27_CAEEX|nr:hypothetical protein CEXT_170251 [Caerostris extrusa]
MFIDDNGTQYKTLRDLSWLQSTNSQVNGQSIAPETVPLPMTEERSTVPESIIPSVWSIYGSTKIEDKMGFSSEPPPFLSLNGLKVV